MPRQAWWIETSVDAQLRQRDERLQSIEELFDAAERSDAVLFFDEADALFGKRSEVRDSHDRYANIEISYLLQRMEAYDGVTVLATNLRANLDEAFTRRCLDRLAHMRQAGATMILVSHDLGFVSKFVKTVICVNRRVDVHPTSELDANAIHANTSGRYAMSLSQSSLATALAFWGPTGSANRP